MICVLGAGSVAQAQEGGDVGVVLSYPASLGIVWHVSDRVALRPAVDFGFSSSEIEGTGLLDSETDSSDIGVTIGAVFYLQRDDRLRTYLVPEFSYARSSSSIDQDELLFPTPPEFPRPDLSFEDHVDTYGVAGSFGAQYALSDRFSAFGEVGLSYKRVSSDDVGNFGVEFRSSDFGTRGAVGVLLYF